MPDPTSPTIHEIEAALDAVLTAMLANRRQRPPVGQGDLQIMSFSEFVSDAARARSLVRDPIDVGMYYALKKLGALLHETVKDTSRMLESAERVSELDPKNSGRRLSILDKAFEGIGSWHA